MYMHVVCARRTGACEESRTMYVHTWCVCMYVGTYVCTYLICTVYSVVGAWVKA